MSSHRLIFVEKWRCFTFVLEISAAREGIDVNTLIAGVNQYGVEGIEICRDCVELDERPRPTETLRVISQRISPTLAMLRPS
jgi:hypothetical protein